MTTPSLVSVVKQVMLALPIFRMKKTLLLIPPADQVLSGVWFDRSAYDKASFSVTAFMMPLCVRAEHLGFTFGTRIRRSSGADRWNLDLPHLVDELIDAVTQHALPLLIRSKTLEGFIDIAKSSPSTVRTCEGLGYALARTGRADEALHVFAELISMLDRKVGWQRKLAVEVIEFCVELKQHPEQAREKLARREEETVHDLGLDEFRNP